MPVGLATPLACDTEGWYETAVPEDWGETAVPEEWVDMPVPLGA